MNFIIGGNSPTIEGNRQLTLISLQISEQLGADGEAITARQRLDLPGIAKAGTHHHRLEAMGFIVVEDSRNRLNTGILCALVILGEGFFVPIVDATHKGRNKEYASVGAGSCLGKAEQQGEVAVNAFPFEDFRSANSLPGRGNFNQHPLPAYAHIFVESDEFSG